MRKVFIKEYPWDHHECWEGKEAEVGREKEPSCDAGSMTISADPSGAAKALCLGLSWLGLYTSSWTSHQVGLAQKRA